jgi:hypothetical protein
MSTLDLLPSIRDSETITCDHCHTRQFPRNGACVRCRRPLGLEYLVMPIENLLNCCGPGCSEQLAHTIGLLLRSMRKRRHMCQSQLAARTGGVNRTHLQSRVRPRTSPTNPTPGACSRTWAHVGHPALRFKRNWSGCETRADLLIASVFFLIDPYVVPKQSGHKADSRSFDR